MGIIKPFKNKDGKILYPITRGEAVFVDDNKKLPTKLEEIETSITDLDTGLTNEFNKINVDNNRLTTAKDITGSINELFQSVSNGKKSVASAITDKGVTTSETETMTGILDNLKKVRTSGDFTTADYDINVDSKGKEVICTVGKKTKKTLITGEGGVLNNTTGKYEIKIKSNNGRSSVSDIYSEDIKTISIPQPLVKGGSIKDNGDETYTYYKPGSGSSGDDGKFIRQSEITDYNFINSGGTFSHKRRNYGYVIDGNILYTVNGQKYADGSWKDFIGVEAFTLDNDTNPILFTKPISGIIYNHEESKCCCSPFYYRNKIIIPLYNGTSSSNKNIGVQVIDLDTNSVATYRSTTTLYNFTTAFNQDNSCLYFIGGINGSGIFNKTIYFYVNIDSLLYNSSITVSATSMSSSINSDINTFSQSQAIYCNGLIYVLDCQKPSNDNFVYHFIINTYSGKIKGMYAQIQDGNVWINSSAKLFNKKIYLFGGIKYTSTSASSLNKNICRIFDTSTMKYEDNTFSLENQITPIFYDNRLLQFQDESLYYSSYSLIANKSTRKNNIDYINTESDSNHFISCKFRNKIYYFYDNGNDNKKYTIYNVDDKSFSVYSQPSTPFLIVTHCRSSNLFIGITATDIYKAKHANGIDLIWTKSDSLTDTLSVSDIYKDNFIEFDGYLYLFESKTNNKIYKIDCKTGTLIESYNGFSNCRKIFKVYNGRVVGYEKESSDNGVVTYKEYTYNTDMKTRVAGRLIKLNDELDSYVFYNNWLFAKCKLFSGDNYGYKLIDTEFGSDELIDVRNLNCVNDIKARYNYNMEIIDNIVYIINGSGGHCSVNYFVFPNINEDIGWGTDGGVHHQVGLGSRIYLLGSNSRDSLISRRLYSYDIFAKTKTTLPPIPSQFATWGFDPVVVGEKIHILGGIDCNNKVYDTMFEVVKSGTIQYSNSYKLPVTLYGYSATEYNSHIYITGGRTAYNDDNTIFNKTLIYYPTDNTWNYGGDLPEKCPDVKIFTYENNLYAVNIGIEFKAWKYSFDTNTWNDWNVEFNPCNITADNIMSKFISIKKLSFSKFMLMSNTHTFIIDMKLNRIYSPNTGSVYSQVLDNNGTSDYRINDYEIYNGYLYIFNIDGSNNISKRFKLIGEEHHYQNYYIYNMRPDKAINMGARILLFYNDNNSIYEYDLNNDNIKDSILYYSSSDDVYKYKINDSFLNVKNSLFILQETKLYRLQSNNSIKEQILFSDTNKKHLMSGNKTETNFYVVNFKLKKIYEISGYVPSANITSTTDLNITENITDDFDSVAIDDSLYLYSAKKPIYKFHNKNIVNTNIICPENIKNSFAYKSGFVLFPSATRSRHYYYFNIDNNTLTKLYLNEYHDESSISFDKNKAYYFGNGNNQLSGIMSYEYMDNSMILLNNDITSRAGAISVMEGTNDIYEFTIDTNMYEFLLMYYDVRVEKWKKIGYYESSFKKCYTVINMYIDSEDNTVNIQSTEINTYDIYINKIKLSDGTITRKKVNDISIPEMVYTTWYKKFLYYIYGGKLYKSNMSNTTSMNITNLPTTTGIRFIPIMQKDNVLLVFVIINKIGQGIGKIDLGTNTYSDLFMDKNNRLINKLWENRISIIDDKLYFFGGNSNYDADTDDVIIYDITNNKFLQGNNVVGFMRPYAQSICTNGDFIYIFSGKCLNSVMSNKSFIKLKKSVFNTLIEPINETIDGNINLKSFNHKTIFNVDETNPNIIYNTTVEVEI